MALIVKIQDIEIQYNDIQVSLRYDAVASTFSFNVYFDPTNKQHKRLFRPMSFNQCKILYKHNDGKIETLITGMIVSHQLKSSSTKNWVTLSGFSITGVLENSSIANFPIQFDGLTLKQITEKVCAPFGLKVVVDPAVADVCDTVANIATVDIKQTCKQYLSELCGQKSVVLSHTQYGDVLLTSIMKITVTETVTTKATTTGVPVTADIVGKKTTSLADNRTVEKNLTAPLYNFTEASSYVTGMELTAAGQDMHSQIIVLGQAGDVNSLDSVANNPYVVSNIPNNNALNTWRPRVLLQTFGTSVDTKICAQSALMQELKNIVLSIDLNTWYLNNKLVRPNYMVTVQNSDLYLFNPTKFFIESVVLRGDEKSGTATLNCVLPEAYNHQTPKNVFI